MTTMRQRSKEEWTGEASRDDINSGSLQRIADATEQIAKNYVRLQSERDQFERYYRQEQAVSKRLARSNAALRGYIGRLKRT